MTIIIWYSVNFALLAMHSLGSRINGQRFDFIDDCVLIKVRMGSKIRNQ